MRYPTRYYGLNQTIATQVRRIRPLCRYPRGISRCCTRACTQLQSYPIRSRVYGSYPIGTEGNHDGPYDSQGGGNKVARFRECR